MHLPDSYQINDDQTRLGGNPPAAPRMACRTDAFVFCHFNYGYKITPELFACWMRILRQTEGSVLWLLDGDPLFAEQSFRRSGEGRASIPRA